MATVLTLLLLLPLTAAPIEVQLEVGTQKVLQVMADSVSVQRPAVLDARPIGGGMLLLAAGEEGTTVLTVKAKGHRPVAYRVTVRPFDEKKAEAELRSLLGNIPGLTISYEGRCPKASCESCTPERREQLERVLTLFFCVRPDTRAREVATVLSGARALLGEGRATTPGLVLDVVGGRVVLTGEVHSDEDAARVEQARRAFPELQVLVTREQRPDGG